MTGAPERPVQEAGPKGFRRLLAGRMRSVVVVLAPILLVVVIALIASAVAGGPERGRDDLEGPLASMVTGTTDELTPGEASTAVSVLPASDRAQPSEEEWAALLPGLEQAAEADPGNAEAQRALALAYYNLGRLDEAAAIYERLLAAGEDAVLRNRLGNTLRDLGDTAAAERAYRTAIATDPTLPAPYLNLAELLWRQNRGPEALATIAQGLEAVPEDGRAPLEEARRILEQSGD